MNRLYHTLTLSLLSILFITTLKAQESNGIKLDNGAVIVPSVYVGSGYESNIALTDTNEIDSFYWQVSPSVLFTATPGETAHQIQLSSDIAKYSTSSEDDYADFFIKYNGGWEPTSRHRFNWNFDQTFGHQKRGSQQTRFQLDRFDEVLKFSSSDALFSYEFGSLVARAQFGSSVGFNAIDYSNFDDFSRQFNRSTVDTSAWFYYRPGNVTYFSADITHSVIDYKDEIAGTPSRNADTTTFLLGAIWEGLAKTTGKFKLGIENRSFEDASRDDITSLAVDAEVAWSPKTYSIVTTSVSRRTVEGVADNDATLNTSFDINWSHSWSQHTTTQVGYDFQKRDEQGSTRNDNQHYVYTSFNRALTKWLVFNAQVRLLVNSSNQPLFDYDNQQISIGVTAQL